LAEDYTSAPLKLFEVQSDREPRLPCDPSVFLWTLKLFEVQSDYEVVNDEDFIRKRAEAEGAVQEFLFCRVRIRPNAKIGSIPQVVVSNPLSDLVTFDQNFNRVGAFLV